LGINPITTNNNYINTMELIPKNKLQNYHLINYDKPSSPFKAKLIPLTEKEAHVLNQAFALNRTTKRYIKV